MPLRPRLTFVAVLLFASVLHAASYDLVFSTYMGGSGWEHARDVAVDAAGNVYIVGGTASADYPTTQGAFQRTQDFTGTQVGSGGYCDGFVSKFSPEGQLLWSTLLGGPNYDRVYAVEVDDDGYVYVAGRAGPGFPVTAGAFQTEYRGSDQGIYGIQTGFVSKILPDGSGLVWSAYVGVNQLCRDIAIDADGEVYVPLNYQGTGGLPPASWFANAFRATPFGGVDVGAAKISADGSTVLWATWMGGSGVEVNNAGIRVDADENVFLNFTTKSADVPTTVGAHDRSYNGGNDVFVAKFSPDGSTLLYGTYFGGSGNEEGNSTHNMAVDPQGNAYIATHTTSTNIPVTPGAFQTTLKGTTGDIVAVKFSPGGELLACTYVGGSDADGADGVYADVEGRLFFTGNTASTDFPVTPGAFQTTRGAPRDAILVVLESDFASLHYASYMGGAAYDDGRGNFIDAAGNLYITGSTNAPGWPLLNPWQPVFAGGGGGQELCYKGGCYAGDVILARFRPRRPGDANGDGAVDIEDFIILKRNYNS